VPGYSGGAHDTKRLERSEQAVPPRGRERGDPRFHAEPAQDLAHVVSHGLHGDAQLIGYLGGRASFGQQAQHFELSGRQLGTRRQSFGLAGWSRAHDAEHSHHLASVLERRGADLHRDADTVGTQKMQVEVGHLRTEELPRERFSRPQCVLRSYDRSDVSSDGVADQFTSCIVEPANASLAVEDVGRDGDSLQRGSKIGRRRA
jgi:hypothetical protein